MLLWISPWSSRTLIPMPKKITSASKRNATYLQAFFKESDKGCVLLAASLFENILSRIHEATILCHVIEDEMPKSFLREKLFQNRAPLSDFNGKISIAFAYGIIDLALFNVLEIIRELRNEAAHCDFDFSLNDVGVRSHLSQLDRFCAELDDASLEVQRFENLFGKHDYQSDKSRFMFSCFVIFRLLDKVLEKHRQR
jgi:DNA-binding MltR family transcriptional regulator